MNEFKRIREKIEELEYHKNNDSITDRGLELLTELHQALQLQQTGVIKSVCEHEPTKNIIPNIYNETQCKKCGEIL